MMYQVPNMPYSLTTEHGRAQSFAHGEQGSFLVREVEKVLEEQEANLAFKVDNMVATELHNLNPIDCESDNLMQELSLFQQELGRHDSKQFVPLLTAYSEERAALVGNISILLKTIDQLKVLVGIKLEEENDSTNWKKKMTAQTEAYNMVDRYLRNNMNDGDYEIYSKALDEVLGLAQAAVEPVALPLDTAPRDGTIVRLLVAFEEHQLDDSSDPMWTIGANSFVNTGNDTWQFVGWSWNQDHFRDGVGTPMGWLPMIGTTPPSTQAAMRAALDALLEADTLLEHEQNQANRTAAIAQLRTQLGNKDGSEQETS